MPLPSHALQPGVQPWLKKKHDWALLQGEVPLTQVLVVGLAHQTKDASQNLCEAGFAGAYGTTTHHL